MTAFIPHDVACERGPNGSVFLRSNVPLHPAARNTGEWLHLWAEKAPHRVFLAERSGEGWRELTYAEALEQVRAVAAGLLDRGLGPQTPIAILSGNSIDHAILSLAGQYVGVAVVPLAEQYALIPEAWPRLRHAITTTRPSLIFADSVERYGAALALDFMAGIDKVVSDSTGAGGLRPFSHLAKAKVGADVDAAHNAVDPQTVAKIMFTSGSTAHPKGVLTTHSMLCVNQAQILSCLPLLEDRPPKILDWLPWNHVFGGNHNFNLALANGGSLYIDNGNPTKKGFPLSVRNTREHAGTLAFNVPIGFANLVAAMRDDRELRRAYFHDLDLIFYAGASVAPETWHALAEFARSETGRLPLMVSGWGMTETSPATTLVHERVGQPGLIGVPMPGVTVKLVPNEDWRYELRVSGPNVMRVLQRCGENRRGFR